MTATKAVELNRYSAEATQPAAQDGAFKSILSAPSLKQAHILKDYRSFAQSESLVRLSLRHKYSDLLIAVDRESWDPRIPTLAAQALLEAYTRLEGYKHPEWFSSFSPIAAFPDAPALVHRMSQASEEAGVGPMASVAGAVADLVLERICASFALRHCAVENGGDCAVLCRDPSLIALGAGDSPFSGRLAVELPAGRWGVATSSGTTGHSVNFGKADACTIVAQSGAEADAWATRCSNAIKDTRGMEAASKLTVGRESIAAFFACAGETMYYRGTLPLVPIGGLTDE